MKRGEDDDEDSEGERCMGWKVVPLEVAMRYREEPSRLAAKKLEKMMPSGAPMWVQQRRPEEDKDEDDTLKRA